MTDRRKIFLFLPTPNIDLIPLYSLLSGCTNCSTTIEYCLPAKLKIPIVQHSITLPRYFVRVGQNKRVVDTQEFPLRVILGVSSRTPRLGQFGNQEGKSCLHSITFSMHIEYAEFPQRV